MIKTFFSIIMLVIVTAPQAWGADCLAVRKKIAQERDMLQKRELVKQGLKDCPNDAVINFTYAYSLERFRKYDEALKHYKISVKLDPKYAKGYFGMGDMYSQLHKPDKAYAAYKKGLVYDPKNKRALKSLAAAEAAARQAGLSLAAPTAAPPANKASSPAKKAAAKGKKGTVKLTATSLGTLPPYDPRKAVNFQQSLNQLPVIALPLQGEKLQSITFKISPQKDNTGLAMDKKMTAN